MLILQEKNISKSILIHTFKNKSCKSYYDIMDQNLMKWKKRTTEWIYNFTYKELGLVKKLNCVLQIQDKDYEKNKYQVL